MTLTKKESRAQSYALAFGIPVGLMLIVMLIAGSEPFGGDVSMLYSDMYHQYFPFWVEFGRAIREGDGLAHLDQLQIQPLQHIGDGADSGRLD